MTCQNCKNSTPIYCPNCYRKHDTDSDWSSNNPFDLGTPEVQGYKTTNANTMSSNNFNERKCEEFEEFITTAEGASMRAYMYTKSEKEMKQFLLSALQSQEAEIKRKVLEVVESRRKAVGSPSEEMLIDDLSQAINNL